MSLVSPIPKALQRPIRLGVLISGGGTTLVNFVEKIASGELNAEIGIVIASKADCSGIERAKEAGIPCEVVSRGAYLNVEEFSNALFTHLKNAQVDLVTLAGFLSLIQIPEDFQYRVMNIHPSLIPSFCGKGFFGHKVHEAVIDRGVKVTGCTVHFADNRYDHGPIILQKPVAVREDDTPDRLASHVFEAECIAYPQAISLYASGKISVDHHRVSIATEK
ncbi:Phosphoribosylglycinamide formyltransferase [hydrothermal vent metagenome]|uniref:phosphoribosylglycinamide formyltransferase 1 n=1 Tax=hydrothermal vent metagenome TaxID=652676 RepID=A0A3B1DS65_9ZZZZ